MDKFFIVGCPRSGTTMVQQGLNRHSRVVIPPETKFFFSFLGHSRACQARHLARLNADLRIRLPEPARRVSSVAEGRAFYEEMARLYVRRVGKRGAACFGEKTPEHTGHLPRIRRLFPGAKVIALYRDGRDVAVSLARMPWMPADLYGSFLVWLHYHRLLQDAQRKGYPDLYFVRYEDVVADPEREFAGMLRFLGLPYEPAVARGWGNKEGVPEREYPWKKRALGRITRDRVGVFRRELSAAQVGVLERLGRHALPSLGYDLLTGGRGPLSPGLLLKLSWSLLRLAYRLPWHAVVHEVFGRSFLCPPGAPPFPAPAPGAARRYAGKLALSESLA